MGQRGPKPKNPALKILAGNPGKRPVEAPRGKRVKRGIPPRPPELTGEAGAEWDRLAAALDECGSLAVVDRGILAAYCLAVADMLAARAEIQRVGRWMNMPIQSSTGETLGTKVIEHPACKLLADASRRIDKFAQALGLSASARSRLEGDTGEKTVTENKVLGIRDRIQAARNGG